MNKLTEADYYTQLFEMKQSMKKKWKGHNPDTIPLSVVNLFGAICDEMARIAEETN